MRNATKKIGWIKLIKNAYPKARPLLAVALVLGISSAPLFNNPTYKIGIAISLGTTLIFLIFDLFNSQNIRLDSIDNSLKEQEPPTYDNFNAAMPTIKEIIAAKLEKNMDVDIKILAISAQFTWKTLVNDTIPELLAIGNNKPKINIDLLITDPDLLHQWGQKLLRAQTDSTQQCIPIFLDRYRKEISEGRLNISVWQYDNIPHWHGVLICDEVFFMGRCKWDIVPEENDQDKIKRLYLEVGTKEYRKFCINDRFKGKARIQMAKQWINAYKYRSERNNNVIIENNKEKRSEQLLSKITTGINESN